MKKSSHQRRRRPGTAPNAEGHSLPGSDHLDNQPGRAISGRMDAAITSASLSGDQPSDNDLADATLQVIDRVRPYFSTILAAVAAGLAALVVFALVSVQSETSRIQGWDACLAAMSSGDVESLNEVIRRYPGTDAAHWAELLVADAAASEGAELLFIDRKRAEGRLQAAVELYSLLVAGRPRGLLAERAVFGLAKARESLGQLSEARRGYEALAAEFPSDALAGVAATRAADLGRESTKQWYDWFGSQASTPPATPPATPETPADADADADAKPESSPPAAGQP